MDVPCEAPFPIDPSTARAAKPYKWGLMAAPVRTGALVWGLFFALAALVVSAGAMPGAASWSAGPRLGITTVFFLLGLLFLVGPLLAGASSRRSRAAGSGTCPVGATCVCGHFNFKPRLACRACGQPTHYA